jgi:hypothetical protein
VRQKASGNRVDARLELAPGPADLLMADDQRFSLGVSRDGRVELDANGCLDQRRRVAAPNMAYFHGVHSLHVPCRTGRLSIDLWDRNSAGLFGREPSDRIPSGWEWTDMPAKLTPLIWPR